MKKKKKFLKKIDENVVGIKSDKKTILKKQKKLYNKFHRKGCNCSKNKCLRLHCVCFRSGLICGKNCRCKGCFNRNDNIEFVEKVRKATKDINSEAFKSKILETTINDKVLRFTKGCSCCKNNCLNNYCECFKYGLGCTPLCQCNGCSNEKCYIEPKIVKQLLNKSSRKKKKIIFKLKEKNKLEMIEEILDYDYSIINEVH